MERHNIELARNNAKLLGYASRSRCNNIAITAGASLSRSVAQVSWIRQRDLHILTVGILTYTNDQRFQSLHSDGSDEWTLKISSPQVRDSGIYECQVSTEPKISQAFNLSVVGSYIFVHTFRYTRPIRFNGELIERIL